MTLKMHSSWKFSCWAMLAFFGFLGFMMQPTAYTWGEQDMMPFFERVFDSNYLANDFFTKTTVSKNPRWVYGYTIVLLSWVTTLPWYKVLYFSKLAFLTFSPIVYFEVLLALLKRHVGETKLKRLIPFVLVSLVAMLFLKEFRHYFSVASWLSYSPSLSAHNCSIFLGFIGILFRENGCNRLTYLFFFVFSCIMHPVMGLLTLGFYIICLTPLLNKEGRDIFIMLASGITAVLVVKFVFAAQQTLPAAEFIDIYVKERHPWHYSVVDYSNRKLHWAIVFAGVNLLFILPMVYGLLNKHKALWQIALAGVLAYAGSIGAQYVFIEIFPSKLMAYMGISRFTIFGYWMLLVIWGMVLIDFLKKEKTFIFPAMHPRNFAFIILNLIFAGAVFLDSPMKSRYMKNKAYYDFVQGTPKDAIFATYSRPLNTDMRLVGKRGVFVGDEFPFAEQYIREYGDRRRLIYGALKDEKEGTAFYRTLKPADFSNISKKYQLDYIVVETSFNAAFENFKPVWENNQYSIYSVDNLRP